MTSSDESLLETENNELKRRVADLESKISTIVSQKNLTKTEITNLFADQKTIADLQSQLYTSQLEESRMRATLQAQESSILESISIDDPLHSKILEMKNKLTVNTAEKEKELMQKLSKAQLEISRLRKQICTCEANNAELLLENNELQARLSDIDGNGLLSGAQKSRFRETIENLQFKYENENKVCNSLKEKIAELTAKYDEDKEILNEKNTELSQKNAELKRNSENDKEKIQNLEEQLRAASSKIAKFEERIKLIEVNASSLSSKNETSGQEITKMAKKIADLNSENQQIKEEKENLERKLKENATKIKSHESKLFNCEQIKEEKENLERKLKESANKIKNLEANLREAQQIKEEKENLAKKAKESSNKIKNLEEKLRESQQTEASLAAKVKLGKEDTLKREEFEEELEKAEEEKEELEKKLRRVIKEKEELESKESELDSRNNELEMELISLRTNNEAIQRKMEGMRNENEETKEQMLSYKKSVLELRSDIEESEKKRKNVNEKNKQLKSQLIELKKEISAISTTHTNELSIQNTQNLVKIKKLNKEIAKEKKINEYFQKQNKELMEKIIRNRNTADLTGKQLEMARSEILELTEKTQTQTKLTPELANRIAREMKKKFVKLNKLYIAKISFLQTQFEQLISSFNQLKVVVECSKFDNKLPNEEKEKLLKQVEMHLRVIDRIANAAGRRVHISKELIPCASELLTDPSSLEEFIRKIKPRKCCNHTNEDVLRALNFPEHF